MKRFLKNHNAAKKIKTKLMNISGTPRKKGTDIIKKIDAVKETIAARKA